MEDGKRLENLSWRLWNRETFCCSPQTRRCNLTPRAKHIPVPALSCSVSSNESDFDELEASPPSPIVRPELFRADSSDHWSRGHEKHITPTDLEKMVMTIQEKKNLEPLPSLSLPAPISAKQAPSDVTPADAKPEPSMHLGPSLESASLAPILTLDSSTSDIDSNCSDPSLNVESADSSSTESTDTSKHAIVRGFEPLKMSSYRSQTLLAAPPAPILASSPRYRPEPSLKASLPKKKGATFTLGGSSGEDEESSLDSHMGKSVSSLSRGLLKPTNKHTSFKDIVNSRAITESPVFEESDDDDDDDDGYENVIEDDEDEDSSDWEDDAGESGNSSMDEKGLFRRVDSRPNIASRRSMLTTMMHEPDRAKALASAASWSSPALRRSRQTSPNGPSATPPPRMQEYVPNHGPEPAKPQPIMVNTPQGQQLALSPRTTRRNMLSTELTESLRKNLLWERQHKSSNNLAAMKRRHTSHDIKNLKQLPEPAPVMSMKGTDRKSSDNEYFHQGLQEYHAKGW